jgi:general stress protein YciG
MQQNARGERPRQLRGFAGMDPQRQREIARAGGKAAHAQGTAHEFTPEEARVAGQKGGEIVSQDRRHMSQIGSRGGRSSGSRRSLEDKPGHPEEASAPGGLYGGR